jgi:hypothetical protein
VYGTAAAALLICNDMVEYANEAYQQEKASSSLGSIAGAVRDGGSEVVVEVPSPGTVSVAWRAASASKVMSKFEITSEEL